MHIFIFSNVGNARASCSVNRRAQVMIIWETERGLFSPSDLPAAAVAGSVFLIEWSGGEGPGKPRYTMPPGTNSCLSKGGGGGDAC